MVIGKRNISDNLSRIVGSEFVVVPFLSWHFCVCVCVRLFVCIVMISTLLLIILLSILLLSCPSHNVLPLAGACLCPLCHCGQVISRSYRLRMHTAWESVRRTRPWVELGRVQTWDICVNLFHFRSCMSYTPKYSCCENWDNLRLPR